MLLSNLEKHQVVKPTVGGNNSVHALRAVDHADCHCIHKHLVMLNDALVLFGYFVEDLVPIQSKSENC